VNRKEVESGSNASHVLPNPKVPNVKFTEANVKSFKPPAGKSDHIEFDDSMPGFGLRVRGSGNKYYIAQYRVGTKSGRTTLGNASKVTLTDAKVRAKKVFDLVAAKINPASQRTKATRVVSAIAAATCTRWRLSANFPSVSRWARIA
jgi:hypothetical protein